ncbi:hypothetical protein D9M71_91570 [compost metagenome]
MQQADLAIAYHQAGLDRRHQQREREAIDKGNDHRDGKNAGRDPGPCIRGCFVGLRAIGDHVSASCANGSLRLSAHLQSALLV